MLGCVPANTPMEENHRIDEDGDGDHADVSRYQRLVGKLIYLSHTRPDITYAVGILSRYLHSSRIRHQEAVYRLLRYLKKALGRDLLFCRNNNLEIEIFTDADWAGFQDDRKSTTGYCSFVGGNLVMWRSKKQNVVARSSANAEYRAMTQGLCLLSIIFDLPIVETENPNVATVVASSLPSSSSSSANTTRTYARHVPYRDPVDVEYHCRNCILSALSDSIYDVFLQYHATKDLWYALEARYNLDNAGIERYNVSNLRKFRIDASKTINLQLHQLDEMSKILADGLILFKNYLVACLIDALPDS
ncbi:hypothetical protein KSP39_PZI011662 [Platanthera zijinensis]|uniref:Mitochondrial protein n=1 Tax=Platanthera zijinensis TaxID=2320716 RepID=A0AAP0BHL6_9ASPA